MNEIISFEFNIDQENIPFIFPLVHDLSGMITLYRDNSCAETTYKSTDLPISIEVIVSDSDYYMMVEFLSFEEESTRNNSKDYAKDLMSCLEYIESIYSDYYKYVLPTSSNKVYPIYQILECILVEDRCSRYMWRGISFIAYGHWDNDHEDGGIIISVGDRILYDYPRTNDKFYQLIAKLMAEMDNGTAPVELYFELPIERMKSARN